MNHSECYKELDDALRTLKESRKSVETLSSISGKILDCWSKEKITEEEFNDLSDRLLDMI